MSYPSKTEFDNLRNSLPLTYQTRGNYAFRTDLASNINTALRNVNTALAFYAKKTDIPIVPANVATKTDLAGYALASDLSKYQPAGRYVSPSELEAYQAKGDYALAKDLVSYAKSSDLVNFQPKGEYALATDLASYAKESSLASYQPKGDYAVKSDLGGYQPKGDYALAADLTSYAKESSLASYQPKGDYAVKSDLAGYQPKGDYAVKSDLAGYQPKGDYAVKSELASYQPKGDYALQTDLAGYQPKGNYQTAGNYALKTELANYALAKDFANLQPKGNYQTAGNYALQTDLAGYQPKGNYQTAGNYALQPTVGNYALQSELAGYVKTAGASTFSGQATFDKNAIVKTEGTTPFQVLGTGGLRVTGGNLSVSGDANIAGSLSANHVFLESGGDPSLRLGPGIKDIGNARLNVQDKAGTYMKFFYGPNETGNISHDGGAVLNFNKVNTNDLYVDSNSNVGNQHVRGIFPAPKTDSQGLHFQWNRSGNDGESWIINNQGLGGADAGIRFGKSDAKNVVTEFGRFNNDGRFKVGGIDSTNVSATTGSISNLSSANASITNLTIGNFNMTGAPTFGALATFKSNATVETTEGKPFQVTGKGGLRVTGGNFTVTGPGDGVGTNGSLLVSGNDAFGHALYVASSSANGKRIGFQRTANEGSIFAYDYGGGVPQNLILQGPGGNVGIGTASPSAKLHVAGSATVEGTLEANSVGINPTDGFTYGNNKLGHYGLKWANETDNKHGPTAFLSSYGGIKMFTQGGERVVIDANGNTTFASGVTVKGGLSTTNASITNLTIGNFNMTGAPTFSALATFKSNAIVETTADKPFQVTGPGGLRVTGGNLTVSGDTSINGNSNVGNQHVRGIFPAPKTDSQGLHFQWNRSGNDGESWIINNPGLGGENAGIRFGKSDAKNVVTEFGRFNNSGAFSVEGSSTFKGASTFNAQATFEKNATVTTTANNPFQVKGDGGLKIAAGGLVVGGDANVSGNKLKLGNATFVAGTDDWVRMTDDAGTFNYGLAGKNLYAASNITASIGGHTSHIQNPNGELKMNQHGIQLGGNNNGQEINSAQISAGIHIPNSLNIVGMGTIDKNRKIDMWAEGGLNVYGSAIVKDGLSANHLFLESGGDPSLRLGPHIKDIGNARLNVQDKAGTYMRFFQGPTETGSITQTTANGTEVNVDKINVNSARFNSTGATTFFPGHTLALDSAGVVGGSFIVKSDATKGNTKVGINNENPTSSLDVVGNANINGNLDVQGRLNANNGISVSSGQNITIRDDYHGIVYSSDVDGPNIYGWSGGKFSTTNPELKDGKKVKQQEVLKWGVNTANQPYLQIGKWIIRDEGALVFYKDNKGIYIREDGWGIVRTVDWKNPIF